MSFCLLVKADTRLSDCRKFTETVETIAKLPVGLEVTDNINDSGTVTHNKMYAVTNEPGHMAESLQMEFDDIDSTCI